MQGDSAHKFHKIQILGDPSAESHCLHPVLRFPSLNSERCRSDRRTDGNCLIVGEFVRPSSVRPLTVSHSERERGQETVDIRQKFVFGQKEIAPRKTGILSLPPSFGPVADRS